MAHFAELNQDNTVTRVIVVGNANITDASGQEQEQLGIAFCKSLFGPTTSWVQTSYNAAFRGCYAGAGYTYDPEADVFLPPAPSDSKVTEVEAEL
jgi:hypothetical protein